MPNCEETAAASFTIVTSDVYHSMHNDRGGWVMIQRNSIHHNDKWSVDINKDFEEHLEGDI